MIDGASKATTMAHSIVWGCAATALVVMTIMTAGKRRRMFEMEKEIERQEALRNGEHAGRVKAEKVCASSELQFGGLREGGGTREAGSTVVESLVVLYQELRALVTRRMRSKGGIFFAPIATVHSCFKECVGTPRQGQFAPSTRALLVFDKSSVSPVALDGVEEFSHLWIFWAFHLNTNMKDTRAHAGGCEESRGHTFPAKVSPPFLKRRVGVFSTRSPHRPNPIGVSLCKVDVVNAAERSIQLSGVDLVNGTPVFDIKPYVPDYDCPRPRCDSVADSVRKDCDVHVARDSSPRVSQCFLTPKGWVGASVRHRCDVEWAPQAEEQLKKLCHGEQRRGQGPRMRFFRGDHEGARRAITESLSVDVRSSRKTREVASAPHCALLFDGLRVLFSATVITPSAQFPTASSGRGSSLSSPPMGTVAAAVTKKAPKDALPGAADVISRPKEFGENSLEGGAAPDRQGSPECPIPPTSIVESVRVMFVEHDTVVDP